MKNLNRTQLLEETQAIVREYLEHPTCGIIGNNWSKERLAKRHSLFSEMLDLTRKARSIESRYDTVKWDAITLFPDQYGEDDRNAVSSWSELTKAAAEIWSTEF